jgi:site-specific DNA recombinase
VPAIIEPEVFAAVQEQLEENRRHARQSQRGARYLLQGLLQCQHCGYAFYGKPLSPSARKGRPRAYAYYRCVGTDAYRFGGHRLCPNTQVRTDRLELTVWQEVCALLAHPERLAQEFPRRLNTDGQEPQQERTALERQVAKLRQGLARLIESYAEGLIEKQEFEPRVTRLRQRITHIEAQCHQLAEAETLQRELQLIIGRVEEFAAQVHQNLEALDWHRQRAILRALVRRVEIGLDQVQVVFRVDAFTGEADPEKKSLQLCKRSKGSALGRTFYGPRRQPVFENAPLQIGSDQLESPLIREPLGQAAHQPVMADAVEKLLQVDIHHVAVALLNVGLGLGDHLVGGSPWPKAIAERGKRGIPPPLQHLQHRLLDQPVKHARNAQFAFLAASWLGDFHPLHQLGLVRPLE